MDSYLLNLLRKNSANTNKGFTHLSTYGPHSKWFIDDPHYENFWKGYCSIVSDVMSGDTSRDICLAEAPRKHMPVVADFTLKFHSIEGQEIETYSIDFILDVVFCYQQIMLKVLQINENCDELICCVLETPEYIEDNLVVFSFRLHFPYCKTLSSVQTRLLRPLVIQLLRFRNTVSRLSQQPVNDWDNIIDPLTSEKPVIMYGSSDRPSIPKLDLQYIFRKVDETNIEEKTTTVMELENTFKLTNHQHVISGIVSASMFSTVDQDLEFWLPLFFSVSYWNGITLSKQEVPNKLSDLSSSMDSRSGRDSPRYDNIDVGSMTEKEMADRFIQMLSRERVEADNYWLNIGQAFFGVYEGDKEGLKRWVEFTETSDAHTPEECGKLYPSFYDKSLTVKTLAWYAREDSPKEYEEWHKEWYYIALDKATSGCHSDVAEALYKVYWLDFACSSLKNSTIYQFTNHIWKKLDKGHTLRKKINMDFQNKYEKYRTDISRKIQDTSDKREKESGEIMVKKINILIKSLKNRAFKNNILAESLEWFKIEKFEEQLDAKPNVIGMFNGVIEAGSKEAVFRSGKPEDYISKSTGITWSDEFHWKHPLVIQLTSWLHRVFPNKELLEYFGKFGGSCLKGRNSDKMFVVMSGGGDNSKSMIKKAFEAAFGAYCITFPTAVFTNKKSAGGPDPAIARSKYAHIAFLQEPDSDTPLKNGTIKEFTGGDRFFARFLHDNGGEIEPMFKLALLCNAIPMFTHSEKAIRNRVKIIPFLSTWVDNPPKSIDEQFKQRLFKKDSEFEDKIPPMAPALLWYFVQMYRKYKKEGLKEPKIVTETTVEYWNDNDIYQQFLGENIEPSYKDVDLSTWPSDKEIPRDEEAKITITQMYNHFKDWFKEYFSSMKVPDKPVVKNELQQRLGKPFQRSWRGIKFKVPLAQI